MKNYLGLLASVFLASRSIDESKDSPLETELVFESTNETQCEDAGIKLSDSALKLVGAGLDVLNSNCGVKTGVAFAAVCWWATRYPYTRNSQQQFARCN